MSVCAHTKRSIFSDLNTNTAFKYCFWLKKTLSPNHIIFLFLEDSAGEKMLPDFKKPLNFTLNFNGMVVEAARSQENESPTADVT